LGHEKRLLHGEFVVLNYQLYNVLGYFSFDNFVKIHFLFRRSEAGAEMGKKFPYVVENRSKTEHSRPIFRYFHRNCYHFLLFGLSGLKATFKVLKPSPATTYILCTATANQPINSISRDGSSTSWSRSSKSNINIPSISFSPAFSNIQAYAQVATSLTAQNITDLTTQLTSFQSSLQTFALNYADEIRQNPQFRSEFARMCSSIGVDPLVGVTTTGTSRRGKGWNLLGVGEFWIRVGTRVVGICRRTRGENGGFISVAEVQRILSSEDKLSRQQQTRIKDIVEISEYLSLTICELRANLEGRYSSKYICFNTIRTRIKCCYIT